MIADELRDSLLLLDGDDETVRVDDARGDADEVEVSDDVCESIDDLDAACRSVLSGDAVIEDVVLAVAVGDDDDTAFADCTEDAVLHGLGPAVELEEGENVARELPLGSAEAEIDSEARGLKLRLGEADDDGDIKALREGLRETPGDAEPDALFVAATLVDETVNEVSSVAEAVAVRV